MASPLGFGDLVLCAGSVPRTDLIARIEAAAAAGFAGLSLFPDDYRRARAAGHSDGELCARLADHGLAVAEIDPLLTWVPEAAGGGVRDEGRAFLAAGEDALFAIADALGARSINAALPDPRGVALARIVDAFGALCTRAARHGLLVTLEFLPWTAIGDAATAARVVAAAGAANGGVMLDAWHWLRSGGDLAGVDAARVFGIQLCDAPAQAEADPIDETLHRRRLPGEGDADLAGLLAHLARGGCASPIGVEVFSDALAAAPVGEIARRCAETARGCLARARRSLDAP